MSTYKIFVKPSSSFSCSIEELAYNMYAKIEGSTLIVDSKRVDRTQVESVLPVYGWSIDFEALKAFRKAEDKKALRREYISLVNTTIGCLAACSIAVIAGAYTIASFSKPSRPVEFDYNSCPQGAAGNNCRAMWWEQQRNK